MSRSLPERLGGLREALEAADGHLPLAEVDPARQVLAKAGARTALGDASVVALAGATGSGKSTLFNALVGSDVSAPGVRRPTTGSAHAAVWSGNGDERAALLDWLGVPRRHLAPADPALDGLVLLDLPDHDSTRMENRLEVDRLVELVDVMIWVVDPQKYADGALHERYLRPYAGHAASLMVVLNQADRLDRQAQLACLADLRRLLAEDGLPGIPVLAVSARTGQGLDELRAEMGRRVRARRAASERLAADVRAAASALSPECGGSAGKVRRADRKALVAALADAAGVPAASAAVEGSMRLRGTAAVGWPVLRWTGKMRADPLRRLHLTGTGTDTGRTSLVVGGVQQARLQSAVRQVRDTADADLGPAWRESLRLQLAEREGGLPDKLDRAVAGTELGVERTPAWWRAVGFVQWVLLACALVGLLWLLGLIGLGSLQLGNVVPTPKVQGIPVPTLLLVGGLLAGLLVAVLCRPLVGATARRRRRRAEGRLRDEVEQVAEAELFQPIAQHREAQDRFCRGLERAAS